MSRSAIWQTLNYHVAALAFDINFGPICNYVGPVVVVFVAAVVVAVRIIIIIISNRHHIALKCSI